MESDSYGIPIELMGGREFGLCDHCKKFQAVGILNDHAWEIAYERYEKLVPDDKKKGRFKQVRRFLPKWYPFRGEDSSKNQRRLEFYEKLGKTPPKTQVKRGSMTSSIGYAYSPTASRAGSDFLPVNTRRGIRRPNTTVPSRPRVQTEVAIVDLTLDDDNDDAEKTQQEQTNQKTNSLADQNNQEENNEKSLLESDSPKKEFFLDEEEELCMKNELSSPPPPLRKISNDSNVSVPSLEDLHPDQLPNEFVDPEPEKNNPTSPKDGSLIIDEDSMSRKSPSNSPLPNSSEAKLTKPDENDKMSNSKEDFDKSEDSVSRINEVQKIVVEQVESSPDKSESEEGNVRSLRAFARKKSILEEAFESIEKDADGASSSEPFDLEKIIQETVGKIGDGGKGTRETEEAPEESVKVAMASDSDSEFKQNFKSREQIEHDSVDEFSYDEESIKSMGKIEAGKVENFDKPNVQRKEEPAHERDSDALVDKKESDCTLEKEEAKKEGKYSQEEFTVELLEGGAHKTEIDNGFEETVPDQSDSTHLTINQDEQDWQNGQAMVREFPIFINQGLANGAAPFKRQRSASIEIESESGEELDVGTRADEIAYYKPLQREEVVVPAQTQENEYIDVMSVKPSMEKPLTVTPELSGSPDVHREGVIMRSFHSQESGRKRGVPEDGGVISDDSPERPGSRTSYLTKEKRSTQRQVNNFIQNAFVDTRASTPALKLVGVTSNDVNFPPASSNTIRHLHPNEYSKVIQPERKRRSPKLQHHPYQRHQVPQTQRIQRVERIPNTQYFTDPAVQQDLQHQVSRMNERRQPAYHQPGFRSSDHSHQAEEELRLYQQMNQAQYQQAHGQRSVPQQSPRGLLTESVRQTSVMQYGNTPVISQDQLNSVLLQNGQAEQYVHSGQLQTGRAHLQERFQQPQVPHPSFNMFRLPFAVPRFPVAPPPFPFYDPKLISPPGKVFPRQNLPAFQSPHQPAPALATSFVEKTREREAVATINRPRPPVSSQFLPKDLNSNSIELRPHIREPFYAHHPHIASSNIIETKAALEPALKPISSTTTSQSSATSSSSSSTSSRSQSSTPQFESIVFKNQNECGQHMFSILDTCFPKKLEF